MEVNSSMSDWIRDKIASKYPVNFGGLNKALRQKLFDDFKQKGPMCDGDDEVIKECEFYSLSDMFEALEESKEWHDDYEQFTKKQYRPTCWFYSEDDNPSLPNRKVSTFHWIEMRYPESESKRVFLGDLADWLDGIQCEQTGRWADLRVYVYDQRVMDIKEVNPIEWWYEHYEEKISARV